MAPFLYVFPQKLIRRLIRPHREIEGYLTEHEAVALFCISNRLPRRSTVVEIGSWKGKSTFCLARGLRAGGIIHAVDPFDASGEPGSVDTYARERSSRPLREQFEENIASVRARVEIHQGNSREFVDSFPTIDLLFLDGDHSIEGVRFDFDNFGPRIPSGGWIAFHDYYPEHSERGPTWVVENLVRPSGQFREYPRAGSLWVAQRK
jgi:predicted O-methyltransferase YrrM